MLSTTITLPPTYAVGLYQPQVDVTGALIDNYVVSELQAVSSDTVGEDTIIPSYAPYYAGTMSLESMDSLGNYSLLVAGVDYWYSYPFISASRALGQSVFAGVTFMPGITSTILRLSYQTLGGLWITGQERNATILLQDTFPAALVSLEQVANYHTEFPSASPIGIGDTTTLTDVSLRLKEIVDKVQTLAASIDQTEAIDHLVNYDNPHQVTRAQIGLDLVSNLPAAHMKHLSDFTNDQVYVNPAQVKHMLTAGNPNASATVLGLVRLNGGMMIGDGLESSKGLTAVGSDNLLQQPTSGVRRALSRGLIPIKIHPYPCVFPVTHAGITYSNQAALTQGVEALTHSSPLPFDSATGTYWLPPATEPIDLLVDSH